MTLRNAHRRNNRRDRGRCIGPPDFLVVVFNKQEIFISQQVVTRMQDLAPEFSKLFRGWYPRALTAGGGDPQHPARPLAGNGEQAPRCWDPNLGPPQFFNRGCAPDAAPSSRHTPP